MISQLKSEIQQLDSIPSTNQHAQCMKCQEWEASHDNQAELCSEARNEIVTLQHVVNNLIQARSEVEKCVRSVMEENNSLKEQNNALILELTQLKNHL